ncbi:MAG: glutamate--cysteine ligase [Candidatus Marinimicrobia bacterium]|nr:glutamate--cysteine ligase [Candidatus Neomarinimicrobiota bacterium]
MSPPGTTFFHSSEGPTIGVESELWLVDTAGWDLTSGAPAILKEFPGDPTVKGELLESIIEINTGICADIGQVRSDLQDRVQAVTKVAAGQGMALISMATHPFARWTDSHVSRSRRYQDFLQRMQFPVRRLLICGLHVHIGVESGEKAVAIVSGLLRYIPHFIGLSANSPFWDGADTGLASTRTKIFEGMPNAGLPPRLTNYSEFQRFMRTLQRAQAIESIREVWWDIRPHPGFGTVEVRVFDAVPTIDAMVSLAALTQCLVVALSALYDDGQQLELLSEWIVRENKWRATRYGMEAEIIVDDEGRQQALRSSVLEMLERLEPYAQELGCTEELAGVEKVANGQPPYQLQLARYKETGDFKALIQAAVADLAGETV